MSHTLGAGGQGTPFLSDRVLASLSRLALGDSSPPSVPVSRDEPPPTEIGFGLGDVLVGGRFRIGERLSFGGMGTVYRAIDVKSGAEVALKIPHVGDPRIDARFELESRALATLRARSLVGYVGHGDGSEPFLAMPLLRGRTLAQRLGEGPLSEREALLVMKRVASGVAALHAAGWVHRDIKPGNIVCAEDGSVKLIDLGLAREVGGDGGGTKTGELLGTLSYMAPEQLTGAKIVDARTDVFALGCVLFECLTGRNAYRRTLTDISTRLVTGGQEPIPDARAHSVDERFASLIETCLATSPGRRPENAVDFLLRLLVMGDGSSAKHMLAWKGDPIELSRALGEFLRQSVRITATSLAQALEFALALGALAAEVDAPSDVLVLEGDPAFTDTPGAHAACLQTCLNLLGHRGLADRFAEEHSAEAWSEASVIVIVDAPEWVDPSSRATLEALAQNGALRVIAVTRDESVFATWPEIALATLTAPAARRPGQSVDDARTTFERWVLRAAAMFGRRFTADGVAAIIDGPERSLVAPTLEALEARGVVRRQSRRGPYSFASADTLSRVLGDMRASDRRIGERVARRYRLESREAGHPACFTSARTSNRCLDR